MAAESEKGQRGPQVDRQQAIDRVVEEELRRPILDFDILQTFTFKSPTAGFNSRSAGGFVLCPPYVIASVAENRVSSDAQLELPEGYTQESLERIQSEFGWVDKDTRISMNHAEELVQIGKQLLWLNKEGKIEPRAGSTMRGLSFTEKDSIKHLVNEVQLRVKPQ